MGVSLMWCANTLARSASLDGGVLMYSWYVELRHLPSIWMWMSEIPASFVMVAATF